MDQSYSAVNTGPRRFGALAAIIAMLIWTAPNVYADESGGGELIDAPTLSLSDLGSSTTTSFYVRRGVAVTNLGFQVPQGLAPATLNATLEVPVKLGSASLAVTQGNRTLSSMALPPDGAAQLVIPLTGAEVSGNWVNITLTATALPPDGYCWDALRPIRLITGSVTFSGKEIAPTTVAGFLPPVLRKLTIAIPAKPSRSESEATVQLATEMARRYGGQYPEVVVVPLAAGRNALESPSQPLERQIIIREGAEPGLSLQGSTGVPALLISGAGNELNNQTRLLTDDSLKFALSPKIVAGQLVADQQFASDSTTLQELNHYGLNSEALRPEVGIDLDQTRFGHSLNGIRVHLIGSHTPLPSSFGGEVRASTRGETVGRWPVEPDGTIDHWVDIPNTMLKRSTTLQVSVQTTGPSGSCGDYLPLNIRIEGSTQIEAQPANSPVPQGFQSLPQAMMPAIEIGMGSDSFGDTARAVQIMTGMQRSSDVPLTTSVTDINHALSSGQSAVIISADGWNENSIALPFSANQGRLTVTGMDRDGKPTTLNLDADIRFGSLQTVFDGRRTLLIATSNGVPAQLDELLRWLSSERGRWSGLDGRAIISLPGAEPVTIPNPPLELSESPSTDGSNQGAHAPAWWAAGGVVAMAVIGAAVLLFRARRSRS
jgi:hypothetical protein